MQIDLANITRKLLRGNYCAERPAQKDLADRPSYRFLADTETKRQRDRETERQTDRQAYRTGTGTETERQRDSETERQRDREDGQADRHPAR